MAEWTSGQLDSWTAYVGLNLSTGLHVSQIQSPIPTPSSSPFIGFISQQWQMQRSMHVHNSNSFQCGQRSAIDSRIRNNQISGWDITLTIASCWWNDEEKRSPSGRIFYHHKPIKLPDELCTGKERPRQGKSKGGEITNNVDHRIHHRVCVGTSADEDTRSWDTGPLRNGVEPHKDRHGLRTEQPDPDS